MPQPYKQRWRARPFEFNSTRTRHVLKLMKNVSVKPTKGRNKDANDMGDLLWRSFKARHKVLNKNYPRVEVSPHNVYYTRACGKA